MMILPAHPKGMGSSYRVRNAGSSLGQRRGFSQTVSGWVWQLQSLLWGMGSILAVSG